MKDKNLGSVYFDKSKNKWVCYYYVYDNKVVYTMIILIISFRK